MTPPSNHTNRPRGELRDPRTLNLDALADQAARRRVRAGELPGPAQILGFADAIGALKLVGHPAGSSRPDGRF